MSNSTRVAPSATPLTFSSLLAHYLIDLNSKPFELACDASCILDSCTATVQTVIDGISDDGSQMAANLKEAAAVLYGVLHQLEMVKSIAGALQVPEARQ